MPNSFDGAAQLQRALADTLKKQRLTRSAAVDAAFRSVPRHLFLPGVPLSQVYSDQVIATKFEGDQAISSSSQPAIMAIMLEMGDFNPGDRVLEIGAGTGYNAALISHLIGESGEITTIDIDQDIVDQAIDNLDQAGYGDRVRVVTADGWLGKAEGAPYNRIILTVAARDISPAWFDQLEIGGRLILPLDVWAGAQFATSFRKRVDGGGAHLISLAASPCGFMPLRGLGGDTESEWTASIDHDWWITRLAGGRSAASSPGWLYRMTETAPREYDTGEEAVSSALLASGFWLWLAARTRDAISVQTRGVGGPLPFLFGRPGESLFTYGLADENGLALLMNDPKGRGGDPGWMRLYVRGWGADRSAIRLVNAVRAWSKAGKPDSHDLQIAAFPRSIPRPLPKGVPLLEKAHFTYALAWRGR